MTIKLPTEYHLEILSLRGGYTGSSKYTLVEMLHYWKSHDVAHMVTLTLRLDPSYPDRHQYQTFIKAQNKSELLSGDIYTGQMKI